MIAYIVDRQGVPRRGWMKLTTPQRIASFSQSLLREDGASRDPAVQKWVKELRGAGDGPLRLKVGFYPLPSGSTLVVEAGTADQILAARSRRDSQGPISVPAKKTAILTTAAAKAEIARLRRRSR